ncbi:MAG TPA: sigma-54-dependent Fis family transcriptional regulator [Rheinheimera sp.]|nr:sigma-54-dependent Fis family transcriptional regulator [Rheinheimera sp.]
MATILVIDDNTAVLHALQTLFSLEGHQVIGCSQLTQVLLLLERPIDLVLQDMNFAKGEMSGEQGRALFYQIKQRRPDLPVILMTAWASLDMVVELVKAGAADYIAKPWDDQRLLTTVNTMLQLGAVKQQQQQLAAREQERQAQFHGKDLCGLVYASTKMEQVLQMALQLAPTHAAVLITGENGTGKEGIAQVLHANSTRRSQPFIKVNMGALPADLMEAELFGAEAGAYTGLGKTRIGRFEAADGGTLFLDEIGNLSLAGQMKLLRVLQTGDFERLGSSQTRHVDVRVVSATNADLTKAIAQGSFRQDLYYRLNVVELHLAPLSQRLDDILPLARHFLPKQKTLSSAAEQALLAYAWPGNVRELQNVCQRAALLAQGDQLEPADLNLPTQTSLAATPDKKERSLDDIDKTQIEQVLAACDGVISRAAKQLGITRQALYRRMEFYGIADR